MRRGKILFLLLAVISVSITGIFGSYALWKYQSTTNANVNTITHGLDYYINYTKGQDITGADLVPSDDYTGGNSVDIELWKSDDTYANIYGHIYLDFNTIGSNLRDSSNLKYTIVSNRTIVADGILTEDTNFSTKLLLANVPLATERTVYTVYIWLLDDFNLDRSISGEELAVTVRCEASMEMIAMPTVASQYIMDLYNNATKTTAVNNGLDYSYAGIYGINGGLMNDRLGGVTTSLDGGNIRYYGRNPNNYIYFNCANYNNQTSASCEKWRIIGVFNDLVKIVRNDWFVNSGGGNAWLSWGEASSDWSESALQLFLNNEYYNRGITTNYTYSNFDGSEVTFNLSTLGLKNDATRSRVATVTWFLGGFNDPAVYSNTMYGYERGDLQCSDCSYDTTWTGKVGLLYPSDYGYAVNFELCDKALNGYNDATCSQNNYLQNDANYWLITPHTSDDYTSWDVNPGGNVGNFRVFERHLVMPTLYLSAEQMIMRGNGTQNNPYQL